MELEKKTVAVSSGFLSDKSEKYLFLKRAEKSSWGVGQWQLPEGKIEWGETAQEAMKREAKEEANCRVKNLELIGISKSRIQSKGIDYHVVRIVFKGKLQGRIKIGPDHSDYKLLKIKDALKLDLASNTAELIKKLEKEGKI